jgi:hypothetical protein
MFLRSDSIAICDPSQHFHQGLFRSRGHLLVGEVAEEGDAN